MTPRSPLLRELTWTTRQRPSSKKDYVPFEAQPASSRFFTDYQDPQTQQRKIHLVACRLVQGVYKGQALLDYQWKHDNDGPFDYVIEAGNPIKDAEPIQLQQALVKWFETSPLAGFIASLIGVLICH